ncbi:MAG: hypothetical protein MUF51_08040, partial [Vicinamibacteria bacterium]|nr:hypothetical protein [Vicinamibacteria bacterium]
MISDHSSKIEQRFVRYALFLLALICMLPFAPGLLQGGSFYFRDLGRYFLPIRLLAYEGFLRGEIRDFNPYLHEGVPLGLPTLAYPIDWLPILCPSPWGVSLLLALHVPLAALGQMQLLRRLGCGASAAFAGGLLFALSGFTLSSLNFYVYIQAIAWAPWIALGFLRFCAGESRAWIMATITLALSISTTGAEITAQTLLVAGALSIGRPLLAWTRRVAFILLTALGLTAPVWMSMQAMLADSTRGAGFPTTVVLAHSVHPLTLLQTL